MKHVNQVFVSNIRCTVKNVYQQDKFIRTLFTMTVKKNFEIF